MSGHSGNLCHIAQLQSFTQLNELVGIKAVQLPLCDRALRFTQKDSSMQH